MLVVKLLYMVESTFNLIKITSCLNLASAEANKRRVSILVSALCDKPSRTFGDKGYEEDEKQRSSGVLA